MYFPSFMLSFLSYTMLAYFIFQIFGRKRWISLIVLLILIAMSFINVVNDIINSIDFIFILGFFIVDTLPIILALILYLYITRAYKQNIKIIKNKGLKLKKLYRTIYPKLYLLYLSVFGTVISFLVMMMLLINIKLEYAEITTLGLSFGLPISGIIFIASFMQMFLSYQLNHEYILLYVGKNKEYCYQFDLLPFRRPISIKDLYTNSDYIVDEMGMIRVYANHLTTQKNYIYWIATSQSIKISDAGFTLIKDPFKENLSDVSKYNKIKLKLKKEKDIYINK